MEMILCLLGIIIDMQLQSVPLIRLNKQMCGFRVTLPYLSFLVKPSIFFFFFFFFSNETLELMLGLCRIIIAMQMQTIGLIRPNKQVCGFRVILPNLSFQVKPGIFFLLFFLEKEKK